MPKRSTLRLTIRSIAALPANGKDAFYWDRDLAGFGVRVQRNGRKVYVVQSRGPAGLKRATLGPVAGIALEQRRREAAKIIDRIKRGLDPIPPQVQPDLTVADLAARCMRAYVNVQCKPKTQALYRYAIDVHIAPALGTMLVKDVRSKHVIELHDRMRDTPVMANKTMAILSKMFSLAATWELVPHGRNPCKRVRRYREEPRERFLSPDEYRSLGAALREVEADGSMWPPAIAAIRLLMLTGCRKSEILTLRWDDVDRTAGEFRLRDGKRGPRMVPLTTPVLRVSAGDHWTALGEYPLPEASRAAAAALPDRPAAIRIRFAVRAAPDTARTFDLPADLVFGGEAWSSIEEAMPLVTQDSALQPHQLAQLLAAAFFSPSDDADADSWETQRNNFEEEALHLATRLLLSDDEACRASIAEAVRRELMWLAPRGRAIDIRIQPPDVTVTLGAATETPS